MSKVLPIIIVLLLLGAGGFFILSNRNQAPVSTETAVNSNSQMQAETSNGQKSLKDLFGLGTAQQCTFKDEAGNGGTVYVGNSKMRGDFATVGPQGALNSHIIVDGDTTYMWMDGQTSGYKMTFDTSATAGTEATAGQGVDLNQKANYDCKTWVATPSMFTLPSGVTFTDFSTMPVPQY